VAEDDHADLGVGRPKRGREADPFVGVRRRHADVREDDVGVLQLDDGEQRLEIPSGRDEVDTFRSFESTDDSLAGEIAVLAQDDAEHRGHRRRVGTTWTKDSAPI
jgi:hypothetical protein